MAPKDGVFLFMIPSKNDINPQTGKAFAINPQTGVWDDNYFANVVEPQLRGGGIGGSTIGGGDTTQIGGQLNISQSLQARYKNILSQLTSRESEQLRQTEIATAREYSKRGIPLSSGAYEQGLSQAKQPISQYFTEQRLGAENSIIDQTMKLQEQQQQQNYQNALLSLQQRKQSFEEQQAAQPQQTPLQLAHLGETGFLFNPYTGQVVNRLQGEKGATVGGGMGW